MFVVLHRQSCSELDGARSYSKAYTWRFSRKIQESNIIVGRHNLGGISTPKKNIWPPPPRFPADTLPAPRPPPPHPSRGETPLLGFSIKPNPPSFLAPRCAISFPFFVLFLFFGGSYVWFLCSLHLSADDFDTCLDNCKKPRLWRLGFLGRHAFEKLRALVAHDCGYPLSRYTCRS